MSLAIQHNVCLRTLNTMALPAQAACFVQVVTLDELKAALSWAKEQSQPVLVLGGGSNLIFAQDFAGLVIRLDLRGIEWLEDGDNPLIRASAGEPWHDFVCWTLQQGLSGLENLSLIPGTVGAAPVQNIGAYGVEVKDAIQNVLALDRETLGIVTLSRDECQFAYRDSSFKQNPQRWVIVGVDFRLSRSFQPQLDYGPIQSELSSRGITQPSALDVSQAVIAIRQSKLPNPKELANAGSFFKNPIVCAAQAEQLQQRYADLVSYPIGDGKVKLAAGWLIDKAGWKGHRQGDAAVHEKQALVLVNFGQATGVHILALAERIQADVLQRFGVALEIEPVVLGK